MNWQISKAAGTPQEVKDQLAKDTKLPQCWKDAIAADIASLPKPPPSVIVMAYSADFEGQRGNVRNIQITIKF